MDGREEFEHELRLGIDKYDQGDFDEALQRFRSASVVEPSNSLAHYWIGEVLFQQERYQDATLVFERVCELDSSSEEYWFKLASAYLQVQREGDGERALRNALTLDPKSLRANFLAGTICTFRGDFEQADLHQRIVAESSEEIGNQLAEIVEEHRSKSDTMANVRRALIAKDVPTDEWPVEDQFSYYRGRGVVLFEERDFDLALIELEKAASLQSRDAYTHHMIGQCYSEKGDQTSALEQFHLAAKLDPTDAHNWMAMSMTLLQAYELEMAADAARKAKSSDPSMTQADYVLSLYYFSIGEDALGSVHRDIVARSNFEACATLDETVASMRAN